MLTSFTTFEISGVVGGGVSYRWAGGVSRGTPPSLDYYSRQLLVFISHAIFLLGCMTNSISTSSQAGRIGRPDFSSYSVLVAAS